MFESLFSFLILISLVFFLFRNTKSNTTTKVKIHRHGHRCYTDNLSYNEQHIVSILAENLSHTEYFIFNNIILPSDKTITTQIDHIVVSKYGVFVIESKNYNHWIFAHHDRKEWVQTTRAGGKYHFHNPIWQNFAHVSALKQQLPFLKNAFYDLVVFSGDCVFKTPRIPNVLYESELIDFIKSKQGVRLKEVELLVVIGKLSMLCQTVETTNTEHVSNIENSLFSPIPSLKTSLKNG